MRLKVSGVTVTIEELQKDYINMANEVNCDLLSGARNRHMRDKTPWGVIIKDLNDMMIDPERAPLTIDEIEQQILNGGPLLDNIEGQLEEYDTDNTTLTVVDQSGNVKLRLELP